MQADNWKIIKATLLEALKLDASGRRAYLEQADISAEVRAEVESLLTQEECAKDFMSVTASGFAREFFEESDQLENSAINQKIGIYEIVSELGFGGMGVVYLAMRRDGKFEQKVAIKMLKREFNTAKIRQTFEREKEILATLSHPNIATLLDAGTTADGVPYLVMEYIEGEPIDEFCEGRQLSLNLRLKLFNKVCDTVSLAHRSLIVHRDLKPSNILVTKDGEPKLLDFGISKLLDVEGEDAGAVTNLGAMTPLYASPEQIKGEPVTTSTDVYSLGVVLFKILTGSLPNSLSKGANGNLLRDLSQAVPTLPSEVAKSERPASADGSRHGHQPPVLTSGSQAGQHPPANAGGSDKPISPSELRGDLDNIVLKALRSEPTRRYQTVEQLSADIWRFVDGRPVLARPATLRYRASKFYGRNKAAVLAVALIVISLFLGIAVALSQAKTAREQARIARQERDAARRAGDRAERTSRFMQSFLDYANPHWFGRGKGRLDVTVREAIDDAAGRIDTELADELEVRADLHYTIGAVYASHGEKERYLSHMQQSYELYRQALGEQHPKVARAIYYLSMARYGMGSDLKEVSAFLREGIVMMRQTEPDNVNLPYMLQQLAHYNMYEQKKDPNENQLAESERLILEAKTLFKRHYGENHSATFSADTSLARLALTRGDLSLAEKLWDANVRLYQSGNERYSYLLAICRLGEVKLALGKVGEADALFEQALAGGRQEWGVKDPRFENLDQEITEARAAAKR